MTALLSPNAKQQFFTNGSTVAAGYLLYTYRANTTDFAATYTNRAGTVANTNPIVLDARGEATIYLDPTVVYDYVLKTAGGATVWTREDVEAAAGSADAVSFTPSGSGATARTVAEYLSDRVNAIARGVKGDGIQVAGATTIASGSNALTVVGAAFVAGDVGKAIEVPGAGVAGAALFATITARTSATQVTLSTTASTALSAVSTTVTYGTDDAAAFQGIIDGLPAIGGTVDVPDRIYMIHTAQNLRNNTKTVFWNIGSGVIFAGTYGARSVSLDAWPRANTNETLHPIGPFVQARPSHAAEGGNVTATAAGVFEALQPATHAGNAVGLYAGARSASPLGYLWAMNILAQADVGYGSTMHGIELDVNVFTLDAAALIKGLGISGIGTALGSGGRKADVGIEIQHGVGWKRGIDILNSDIAIQIRSTCLAGIELYDPLTTEAGIALKQRANNTAGIVVERFTDTASTGSFLTFKTAAGADLVNFGVDGNASIAGILIAGGFSTSGTTDTFNMLLRFPAPAGGAGQVGLGNGVSTTVGAAGGASALPATPLGYWSATVNGTAVKIPYYSA